MPLWNWRPICLPKHVRTLHKHDRDYKWTEPRVRRDVVLAGADGVGGGEDVAEGAAAVGGGGCELGCVRVNQLCYVSPPIDDGRVLPVYDVSLQYIRSRRSMTWNVIVYSR